MKWYRRASREREEKMKNNFMSGQIFRSKYSKYFHIIISLNAFNSNAYRFFALPFTLTLSALVGPRFSEMSRSISLNIFYKCDDYDEDCLFNIHYCTHTMSQFVGCRWVNFKRKNEMGKECDVPRNMCASNDYYLHNATCGVCGCFHHCCCCWWQHYSWFFSRSFLFPTSSSSSAPCENNLCSTLAYIRSAHDLCTLCDDANYSTFFRDNKLSKKIEWNGSVWCWIGTMTQYVVSKQERKRLK